MLYFETSLILTNDFALFFYLFLLLFCAEYFKPFLFNYIMNLVRLSVRIHLTDKMYSLITVGDEEMFQIVIIQVIDLHVSFNFQK